MFDGGGDSVGWLVGRQGWVGLVWYVGFGLVWVERESGGRGMCG